MDLAGRARLAVSAASIEPPALPPGATFLIRRMQDPLPGRLLQSPHGTAPSAEWQQAARSKLSELVREASRPACYASPGDDIADAPQVLFNDDAELLACFARDVATGRAASRWWWKRIVARVRGGSFASMAETLAGAFVERAAAVPAAFELLFKWHVAAPLLQILGPRYSQTVLLAVAREFRMALPDVTPGDARFGSAGNDEVHDPAWVPVSGFASLSFESLRLAGCCLVITREPWKIRSAGLWRHIEAALHKACIVRRTVKPVDREPTLTTPPEAHPSDPAHVEPLPEQAIEPEAFIGTEAGGVFFLIPALRALGLFDELPEEASPWVLLELCGKCLLGDRYAGFAFDPVWRLLRQIAGHDPDFPLPDIDPHGDPRGRAPNAPAAPLAMREIPPNWGSFIGQILPGLRSSLEEALDVTDLSDALLLRRAAIYTTRTHVDVVMPLNASTGPVRRAGLDLNPGWVPVLARIVSFHYRETLT